MSLYPTLFDGDTDAEIVLPSKWEICGTCSGNGKHSLRFGAITQEDRYADWDEDSFADYCEGHYDHRCGDCEGEGKVRVADRSQMTRDQIHKWDAQVSDNYEIDAIQRAEIAFGC